VSVQTNGGRRWSFGGTAGFLHILHSILLLAAEECVSVQNDSKDSELTIQSLEQNLVALVRKLEARVERKMQYMGSRLKALSKEKCEDQLCDFTIEKLEQSLSAMEARIEDRINRKIQPIDIRLKEISSAQTSSHAHPALRESLEKRVSSVEHRLQSISDFFGITENKLESIAEAVGVTVEANAGDDDADRKRLKEKLKEALEEEQKERLLKQNEGESWMEYIFGICKPDGRMGKTGSRCVPSKI
jgi:hypothetical protein